MKPAEELHGERIAALTSARDWAALLRYYVVHQQDEAFESALLLAKVSAEPGAAGAASLLEEIRENPAKRNIQDYAAVLEQIGDEKSKAGLAALLLSAPAGLAESAGAVPVDLPDDARRQLLDFGLKMSLKGVEVAETLGDRGLLAFFLSKAAAGQKNLERKEDALRSAEIAASLRVGLVKTEPGLFRTALAQSMIQLSELLLDLDRSADAQTAAAQAVTICQALGEDDAAELRPSLAQTLFSTAAFLNTEGRLQEAVAMTEMAAELYWKLVAADPEAFTPRLAACMHMYSDMLGAGGNREAELEAAALAANFYRLAAQNDPAQFAPLRAMLLARLAAGLSALDRRAEALEPSRQAVETYRSLYRSDPAQFGQPLAAALTTLATLLAALGHPEEAAAVSAEAAGLTL